MNPLFVAVLVFVALPAWWYLLTSIIARFSGWLALARGFRTRMPFTGNRWWFQSAEFGRTAHYSNCLTVGANAEGLYLAALFLFRPGHPPLFIPWESVVVEMQRRFLRRRMGFRFPDVPGVSVTISEKLGKKIASAAASRWADVPSVSDSSIEPPAPATSPR